MGSSGGWIKAPGIEEQRGWIKALRVEEQWEAVSAEAEVWGEVG